MPNISTDDFAAFESAMHNAMEELRRLALGQAEQGDIYSVHHLVTTMNGLGRTVYTIKRRYSV